MTLAATPLSYQQLTSAASLSQDASLVMPPTIAQVTRDPLLAATGANSNSSFRFSTYTAGNHSVCLYLASRSAASGDQLIPPILMKNVYIAPVVNVNAFSPLTSFADMRTVVTVHGVGLHRSFSTVVLVRQSRLDFPLTGTYLENYHSTLQPGTPGATSYCEGALSNNTLTTYSYPTTPPVSPSSSPFSESIPAVSYTHLTLPTKRIV
eukprot:TRINITY_DN56210_c0_g1_i1.p1 TRINITY_DN56210_c0_g1~~TRINITY_DN56210_c0_g1_i1.p1  ORF type:complete len:208 (+),score=23.59 TRINITY_DN56210_c0_g1_i1:597-1220(+)